MAENRLKPWLQWLALVGIMLAGLLLVLGVAEGAARLFFPELAPARADRVKFWNYDSLLGWSHVPNKDGVFSHRDFSVKVHHNSAGLRDKEYPLERTNRKRMLQLGDSFTWGFGVEEGQRYSDLLEVTHADWEIIDAGVSGYSTDQEYLYLRERGMRYQPDVVTLQIFPDDFLGNLEDTFYLYNKPRFDVRDGALQLAQPEVPEGSWRQGIQRTLMQGTYLGSVTYQALLGLSAKGGPLARVAAITVGEPPGAKASVNPVTRELLIAMNRLCTEHKARFFVFAHRLPPEMNDWLAALAKQAGFAYHALDPVLAASKEPFRFPHDAHWNIHGHDIVAKDIDSFLTQQGVW